MGYTIIRKGMDSMKKIIAKDNYTLEVEGEFDSMEEFWTAFPSAEITATEETDTAIIIYS